MNINDLTIGQAKELSRFFNTEKTSTSIFDDYIGKYVIVRSKNEGLNAGFVIKADSAGIVLKDARRLFYHKPLDKSTSWYEGVAKTGLSNDSKIGEPVEKFIVEDYSITIVSDTAKKSIIEAKTNEQN